MNRRFERVRPSLVCPSCRGALRQEPAEFVCLECARRFGFVNGAPLLRLEGAEGDGGDEERYRRGLRSRLRRHPSVYRWVFRLLAPVLVTGPDPAKLMAPLVDAGGLVLDLGAGNDRRHEEFTNVDVVAYPEVDVLADVEALPLAEGSVDGIVAIALFEHLPEPERLIDEALRVLRSGGLIYLAAPFLQPFHAAPHDFRRWTLPGLERQITGGGRFRTVDRGIYCGPASALAWIVAEWMALIFSLGQPFLRQALSLPFQVVFSPIKWLDTVLSRLPGASAMASVVYVVAERMPDSVAQED